MARHRKNTMPLPPGEGGYEFEVVELGPSSYFTPPPTVAARGGLIPVGDGEGLPPRAAPPPVRRADVKRMADAYRGQGYDIIVQPSPDQLPPFAKDFRVEIVGRRGSEGVLVAVKKNRDEFAADGNMQRYAEITGTQPGWRFDFAILEAENPKARELRGAREFSGDDISHSLEQAGELSQMGFPRFAVIAALAALEAAMRLRLRASGQEAGWGSKPREMLKELYSAGAFSPDEFRQVEMASLVRNQVVHGFASQPTEVGQSEAEMVRLLSDVTRRLVNESQPA